MRKIENNTKRQEGSARDERVVVEVRQYQTRPRNSGVRGVFMGKRKKGPKSQKKT